MEQKINELLNRALSLMGEESNILIVVNKNDQCGAIIHGKADEVAQSVFACMHHNTASISQNIYRIVKLNTLNILANSSPYTKDLLNSIERITDMQPEQNPQDNE